MTGNSLWSALMVAWLSATNVPLSPDHAAFSDLSVSDRESDDDTGSVIDVRDYDDMITAPESGLRSTDGIKTTE